MKIHFTSRRMVKVLHICREMHDDRVSAKLSVYMGIYTFHAVAAVSAVACVHETLTKTECQREGKCNIIEKKMYIIIFFPLHPIPASPSHSTVQPLVLHVWDLRHEVIC